MKAIDYNKALSKDRAYFNDTIKKTDEAAKRRIADAEERTSHKVIKQRDNFIEDKAELETNYQANLEKLNEKTAAAIDDTHGKVNEERVKEREAFTQESLKKKKDFDQRLNDITKSYKKAADSESTTHDSIQGYDKNKYDKVIGETKTHSDQQLKNYRDKMSKAGQELKEQYSNERQNLDRSHENDISQVHKDHGNKTEEMRSHLRGDLKKTKEVQTADLENQKKYFDERTAHLQNKTETRANDMASEYGERTDKQAKAYQADSLKTSKENSHSLMEVRRGFNKELRDMELEKRRASSGTGDSAEALNRQKGMKDDDLMNRRVDSLKEQFAGSKRVYEQKAFKDQDTFNETLKLEKSEATSKLDKSLKEANIDKIVVVSKEREKAEAQVANRENQNRLDKQAYEQQMMLERNNAGDRLSKLKENFNTSMKRMEEEHKLTMDDVTKVSNDDKAGFVKKLNEERNKEIFGLKREFAKMMDSTVQEYEQRLTTYQRDNEYLKMSMDQKVQNIMDQTSKQVESQRTLFEDRRNADIKTNQLLVDQREHTLKTSMNQMNTNFQKKIDKMQVENDSKLKLLTNDYENKLKELKATTSKELAMKDTNQQIELNRIKMAYEEEKNRIIQGYDNQIASIKAGHKDQVDQLQDFKRLS